MTSQGHSISQWTPLFLAMEGSLYNCSGFLNFSDKVSFCFSFFFNLLIFIQEFRLAVEKTYLNSPTKKKFAHENLANYFVNLTENFQRKVEEFPWQIAQLGDPKRLREVLTDLDVFQVKISRQKKSQKKLR